MKSFSFLGLFFSFLIILFFSFYFFATGKFFIQGPKIILLNPKEDIRTESRLIKIEGKIKGQIKNLTINNEKLYIGEDGVFNQKINLASGLNKIVLKAEDQNNRSDIITRKIFVIQ
ncbi:MAG: hypothetical protein HYV52_01635 [Parcubacteria group bacterium]|nr:hypothetical protein [Parcubacteria group bacterium]